MKKIMLLIALLAMVVSSCTKSNDKDDPVTQPNKDTSLVNTTFLDYITVPVTFSNGNKAAGLYIYSAAPSYTPIYATNEGYTCVDDVSRAVLFYIRSSSFTTDTSFRNKGMNLIRFVLNMQSDNGYFYNFLQTNNVINTSGITSVNGPHWWSWRALQAISEGVEKVRPLNPQLASDMDNAIAKIVISIKKDLIPIPQTMVTAGGISLPGWLPDGADAASTLVLGLIPYCKASNDSDIKLFIKKLCDGIVLMQQGDADHFPYSCILSALNTWHAYGSDQAHTLFSAAAFLNEPAYKATALAEVDHFFTWLLQSGFKNSFAVEETDGVLSPVNMRDFEQIAYATRPLVFGALDAFDATNDPKYTQLAGDIAAWFLGKNAALTKMYDVKTGRPYDGISGPTMVNKNAGAESVVEALLTMQRAQQYPAVKAILDTYK